MFFVSNLLSSSQAGRRRFEENARNSVESSGSLVIHFTTPFSV
jgi:hypothetical protein